MKNEILFKSSLSATNTLGDRIRSPVLIANWAIFETFLIPLGRKRLMKLGY